VAFGPLFLLEEPELLRAGEVLEEDLALAGRDLVGLICL
jgi:hypothetical protein